MGDENRGKDISDLLGPEGRAAVVIAACTGVFCALTSDSEAYYFWKVAAAPGLVAAYINNIRHEERTLLKKAGMFCFDAYMSSSAYYLAAYLTNKF